MTAKKHVTGPERDEAAKVRRLALRATELLDRAIASPELQEALVLGRHLRAGRAEDAILVHRVLVNVIRDELGEIGQIEETYASLLNALHAFLDAEAYAWGPKGWGPDAVVLALEARRGAGEGNASPAAG